MPRLFGMHHSLYFLSKEQHRCQTIKDTLTQKAVYISADILPKSEGGATFFLKALERIHTDSVPANYDGHFIVAFIVDTGGQVYGERMIKAPIYNTGIAIINSLKKLRWNPAMYNGQKVSMLYTQEFYIDIAEN
jgi:hypothetical protein